MMFHLFAILYLEVSPYSILAEHDAVMTISSHPSLIYIRVLKSSVVSGSLSSLHLQSPQDGGHSAVQGVPSPVAFVDHGFELAGSVSAILSGQAAVLVIDQFKLGQPLMYLSLKALKKNRESWDESWIQSNNK